MINLKTGIKCLPASGADPVTHLHSDEDLRMFEMIQIYLFRMIGRFRNDEQGAALVEYGLLLGLIAVICIVAVTLLGGKVSNAFSSIAAALPAA
jgi:pilus assembly protein Flp/PilA